MGSHVPDFRGLFLRGFGQQAHTQINGSTVGQTTTTHRSGSLGEIQGDAIRNIEELEPTILSGTTSWFNRYWGTWANIATRCEGPMCDGYESRPTLVSQDAWMANYFHPKLNLSKGLQQPMDNEIRPVNTAVRYLIRARS